MTQPHPIKQMVGRRVTVTHSDAPYRTWHGRLLTHVHQPTILLQTADGTRECLLAAFHVQPAEPPSAGTGPDAVALDALFRRLGLIREDT